MLVVRVYLYVFLNVGWDGTGGGMSERVLQIVGGWKKIPDTYMRTLGYEDAEKFHRQISPADKLGGGLDTVKRWGRL